MEREGGIKRERADTTTLWFCNSYTPLTVYITRATSR